MFPSHFIFTCRNHLNLTYLALSPNLLTWAGILVHVWTHAILTYEVTCTLPNMVFIYPGCGIRASLCLCNTHHISVSVLWRQVNLGGQTGTHRRTDSRQRVLYYRDVRLVSYRMALGLGCVHIQQQSFQLSSIFSNFWLWTGDMQTPG